MLNTSSFVIPAHAGIYVSNLVKFNLMLAAPLPIPSPAGGRGTDLVNRLRFGNGGVM